MGWRVLALVALLGASPAVGYAQEPQPPRRWQAGAGIALLGLADSDEWTIGPEFNFRVMASSRVGLELRGTWLTTNTAKDEFSGVMGRFGTVIAWRKPRTTFAFAGGFAIATTLSETGFRPGDLGRATAAGVYGDLSGSYWFTRSLGASVEVGRIIWLGGSGSTASAGLALRW